MFDLYFLIICLFLDNFKARTSKVPKLLTFRHVVCFCSTVVSSIPLLVPVGTSFSTSHSVFPSHFPQPPIVQNGGKVK